MTMTNFNNRRKTWAFGFIGLACFALLLSLEIATETEDLSLFDILVDALTTLLTIGAAVGVALLALRLQVQREENLGLLHDLATARAEGDRWHTKVRSHLAGLRAAIDMQFEEWGMTRAEREIGRLLLRGLSHREIATLRASTEVTVRQQAQSIYRKAGLPGKTAFVAYFLNDLFQPEADVDSGQIASGDDIDRNASETAVQPNRE
jgi:DNA-binding CsgD family transcriptional regulator